MKNKYFIPLIIISTILCFKLFSFTIFYYNPDSNITNYQLLIKYYSNYFEKFEPNFRLQPFSNIETFFDVLKTENPDFLKIPYYNFVLIKSSITKDTSMVITPILKSSGKNTYKKFVLTLRSNPVNKKGAVFIIAPFFSLQVLILLINSVVKKINIAYQKYHSYYKNNIKLSF